MTRRKKPEGDEYLGDRNLTKRRWEPVIDGERYTLKQWEYIYGVTVECICNRVDHGWDWESAITKPSRGYTVTDAVKRPKKRRRKAKDGIEAQ